MSLDVKKLKGKNDCFFSRMNCSKQGTHDVFQGWNASSKVRLIFFKVLNDQES